jgi:galactonate dehydratase
MPRFLYNNRTQLHAALEFACLDIIGKKLGVPVYQLLGGKVQERLRVYANGWTEGVEKSPASYAARTKELVAKGYTGCKFDPFSGGPMNREVTQAQLRDAVALVKAIREAGGPDYDIAIDVHARGTQVDDRDHPRHPGLPPVLLRGSGAAGEHRRDGRGPAQRRSAARDRRAHLRPARLPPAAREAGRPHHPADIARTGGITEFKKIARWPNHYIPVAPHNPNGPICTVASIHACVSIPNFLILEFFEPDEAVFNEIIPGGLRGDRGSIPPIEGPGLGITISDDFLKKHAFDEKKTDEMEKRVFDTITFR